MTRFVMLRCVMCIAMANDQAVTDPQNARKLGRASYIVSSVGILVTVVICAIVIGVTATNCHEYDGICYKHKTYTFSASDCLDQYNGVYHGGYCYYDWK